MKPKLGHHFALFHKIEDDIIQCRQEVITKRTTLPGGIAMADVESELFNVS